MYEHNNVIQDLLKLIGQTINLFTSHLDCQTMCLVSLHQQIKHIFTSSKQQSQFFIYKDFFF
jgi:hypothetical protein